MNFLDLFSGIGGFRLGLEKAGHKCVGFCEIDKYARITYKANFNTKGEWESHDITTVTSAEIERIRDERTIDLICGGFPCQAFSIAGKRLGFDDTRGTMFFEVCRFISIIKPKSCSLKTLKDYCLTTTEQLFSQSSIRWGNSGMMSNGKYLIQKITEYHRTENECSLSDILETEVEEKYFLSDEQTAKLLSKLEI